MKLLIQYRIEYTWRSRKMLTLFENVSFWKMLSILHVVLKLQITLKVLLPLYVVKIS